MLQLHSGADQDAILLEADSKSGFFGDLTFLYKKGKVSSIDVRLALVSYT
jgi:hypothetical protein